MIKCTFLLRRRPELSRAEFLSYWLNKHAPLAREIAEAMRIRRYVQVHPAEHPMAQISAASRGSAIADYDGVTEVWWDSFEDMEAVAATTSQELAAKVLADEARFVDFSRSEFFFGREHEIIADRSA